VATFSKVLFGPVEGLRQLCDQPTRRLERFPLRPAWLILLHGGLLIFDDYVWQTELPSHDRPQMAIDTFSRASTTEYELLHKQYQVIVRKSDSRGNDGRRG